MENELLIKVEALKDASEDMANKVPGMFAGAVAPVSDMVDGILDLMVDLVVAIEQLQETRH